MRSCPKCGATYPDEAQFCPQDGSALGPGLEGVSGDPRVGTLVDRYRVVEKLGEGGMGVVYRGEHTLIGRPVALKLLHPDLARDPQAVDRFFREARAANEIANPHIVEVTDFGRTDDDANFLVMEFLTGVGLHQVLAQQGALSPSRAVHIALQIANGLSAAHEKGVIHRDLKPGNIQLVERNGDPEFVKIMDFGIAKITETTAHLTKTGMILGSPAYMSPEQASGKPVDHRTDIYAFGIMLYEMLTGKPPFVGDSPTQILVAHVTQEPSPPRALNSQVPEALEQLVLRCLAKEVDGRPETMARVAEPLGSWQQSATRLGPIAMAPTAHAPVADTTLPPPTAPAPAAATAAVPAPSPTAAPEPPAPAPAPVAAETAPPLAATPISASTPRDVVDTCIPPTIGTGVRPPPGPVGVQRPQRSGKGLVVAVIAGSLLLLAGGAVAAVLLLGDDGKTDAGATKLAAALKTAPRATTKDPGETGAKEPLPEPDEPEPKPNTRPEPDQPGPGPRPEPDEPGPTEPAPTRNAPKTAGGGEKDTGDPGEPRLDRPRPAWPDGNRKKPGGKPRPAPKPAPLTRRLSSVPSGAAVYEGKKLLGMTPLTLKVDRPRRLALAKRGYKPTYLKVTTTPGPIRVTMRRELPEWQRTRSFRRLKEIHRSGRISRRQYTQRRDQIKRELRYRIELIVRRYKRGEISRSERRRLVRELKRTYR